MSKIIPPDVDTRLLQQTSSLAVNLCGFPCEVSLFSDNKTGETKGYRIQPDLKLVESNIMIYSYLKDFSIWYLKAHDIDTLPGQIRTFSHLITALFDFGMYWNTFKALDPGRAAVMTQLCQQAMQAAAKEIAQLQEQKRAAN